VSVSALNGFNGAVSLTAAGFGVGASGTLSPSSMTGSGTSTLTVTTIASAATGSFPLTITGVSGSLIHSKTVTLVVTAPAAAVIANGGFETGNLTGWTASGATSVSARSHADSFAAQVGSANPYPGDSSVSQTFTAPSGTGHTLSFWYLVVCTDSVRYDWATATLRDNTAGTTTTPLAKTCTNGAGYKQVTATVTAGHSYTLTLTSHDDNFAGDATFTAFDDVVVA
jgi:hypothetical protein